MQDILFPLVIRQDGSLQRLEAGGLMIGMYPDDMICQMSEFEDETIQLYSGDTVIFFTDGVTETQDIHDEMYDEERLEELVKETPQRRCQLKSARKFITQR